MKLLIAALFVSSAAFSAPIFCSSQRSHYTVEVSSDNRTAQILVKEVAPQFGNLKCEFVASIPEATKRPFMACRSQAVVDAGFSVVLSRTDLGETMADVHKTTFAGSKRVATLFCAEAQ